jgi:hypothetical protein
MTHIWSAWINRTSYVCTSCSLKPRVHLYNNTNVIELHHVSVARRERLILYIFTVINTVRSNGNALMFLWAEQFGSSSLQRFPTTIVLQWLLVAHRPSEDYFAVDWLKDTSLPPGPANMVSRRHVHDVKPSAVEGLKKDGRREWNLGSCNRKLAPCPQKF